MFSFVFLPGILLAGNKKMDLSEALKNNTIKLEAINFKGLYQGKTTRLSITNNTKSAVEIKVDLGTILKPEEPGYQPMVLAGEEILVVLPHATGQMEVQTFCGDAPGSCPKTDLHYSFSHVANDTFVKVLQFINTNKLFDYLGQDAVWVMTNGHNLNSVYDPERVELSKKFIELIVAVTGRPRPEYYTSNATAQVPNEPAYVPKVLKIYAQFEIILQAPKTMTLGIFDQEGNMAQPVFENKEFGISGHRFDVEFEASNVPAGKYYIRLKEGETVLQEKMVVVE